jgi:hypothetical protein
MKISVQSILIFIISVLYSENVISQDTIQKDTLKSIFHKNTQKSPAKLLDKNKLHFSMDFGVGYVGGSKYFSGSYSSFSPSWTYQLTSKLNLEFGGMLFIGNSNLFSNSPIISKEAIHQNSNQYILFTKGQYQLTNKITMNGSAFKTFNSQSSSTINPNYLDFKGVNVGLNYKITDNVNLGAAIRFSNGLNNFLLPEMNGPFLPFQENVIGW